MRHLYLLVLTLALVSCQPTKHPTPDQLQGVNASIEIAALVAQSVCSAKYPDKAAQCRDALIPVVDGTKALSNAIMARDPNAYKLAGCVAKSVALAQERYTKLGIDVPELRYAAIGAMAFQPWADASCSPTAPGTVTTVHVDPQVADPGDL